MRTSTAARRQLHAELHALRTARKEAGTKEAARRASENPDVMRHIFSMLLADVHGADFKALCAAADLLLVADFSTRKDSLKRPTFLGSISTCATFSLVLRL